MLRRTRQLGRSGFYLSAGLIGALTLSACGKDSKNAAQVNPEVQRREQSLESTANEVNKLRSSAKKSSNPVVAASLNEAADKLEAKLSEKLEMSNLTGQNTAQLERAMAGHTNLYKFSGTYRILVIPVQFKDETFAEPSFFEPGENGKSPAQNYLFGEKSNSLTTYYKHASLGQLNVTGDVIKPVTVDKDLVYYGEAVTGNNDRDARRLVIDALQKVKETHTDGQWWEQFDNWDLSDYDLDKNFHEPDGFIDAVVLIYAGKAQSSCQRSFDPDGLKPASADVPAGPRQAATVECFNRIWPHRWSISVPSEDPLFSSKGPIVEGVQRPAMNGLKINDNLFAFDYNMQSEFSDLSTFQHEFGHSLSLPDVYAYSGTNNTGGWDIMSGTLNQVGQEMSTFSKVSLGWSAPKVVRQGQNTSAYLGNWNFVPNQQREHADQFSGPVRFEELLDGQFNSYDVLSVTPEFQEPVYRSVAVITDPSTEWVKVAEFPEFVGKRAVYSGRYDNESRSYTLKVAVPQEGDANLSFDLLYAIETETNFDSSEEQIRVVTDFDLGSIVIDGHVKEDLRLISGDTNNDSLNDSNQACNATRALELRAKKATEEGLTDDEKKEFADVVKVCKEPTWLKKSFDLSEFRGKTVDVELRLVTDAGYTEMGIIADNFKLGEQVLADFESDSAEHGRWVVLGNEGKEPKQYQQMYFMEYRDPREDFKSQSLNYDVGLNNFAGQSFFASKDQNALDSFRSVDFGYQPGVLVWYYNTRFTRRDNGASIQNGKGYLLLLNAYAKEVKLPGIFNDASLLDGNGVYRPDADPLKSLVAEQKNRFACASHIEYATYLEGVTPACTETEIDVLRGITKNNKPLRFRREWFNNVLPQERDNFEAIGEPFRSDEGIRAAMATFRPESAPAFNPFRISKVLDGKLIASDEETAAAPSFKSASGFNDASSVLSTDTRFLGDNVVVEKKGFAFKVYDPSDRIVRSYGEQSDAAANASIYRRPRAKLVFNWAKLQEGVNPILGEDFKPAAQPTHIHGRSCNHD